MANLDSSQIQSMVQSAREKGKEIDLSDLMEITDDMPLKDVVWYYNNLSGKRFEIERLYFDKYKTYQDWYQVYKLSGEKDVTHDLSLTKIKSYMVSIQDMLEIYDVDFSDERLRKLTFDLIMERTPDEFDQWLFIYDATIFDKRLNKIALKKCLQFAQTKDDWQAIYERSDIGTPIQLKAIQQLYGQVRLTAEEKRLAEKSKEELGDDKSQEEYRELYEKENFGTARQGNLLVSKYIAADAALKDEEESDKDK